MRRRLLWVLWLVCAAGLIPAQAEEETSAPLPITFGLTLRLGAFEMTQAADSYDAVFGEVMPQLGIGFELEIGRRWLVGLTYDYGQVDGERVLPADPPIGTGVSEELTYRPLALTLAWRFRPEARLSPYVGAGAMIVDWQDESSGQSASGSDTGYHLVLGLRREGDGAGRGGRFRWGGELRYSTVPDAIGEAGISRFFGEDDIGGLSLHLLAGWRLR